MPHNPILFLIASPILLGILCLVLPDRVKGLIKSISFLVTLAAFAVSISVFIKKPVILQAGNSVIFLADNMSAFIGIGITFFAFLVAVYSSSFVEKSLGRYFGYVLMTLGSSLAVAFANNLIVLLVFWGMLAALLYLLVNMSGTDASAQVAKKALITIGGTDVLLILGIAFLWSLTGTFTMDKINLQLNGAMPFAAYLFIAIAAFAKAGAMPFHSWLPDVAQDGPTPVTAYLPASLDKLLGIYLLARASLNLFVMNKISNLILLTVGAVTIILAVIFALVQHDMKRLLGYHAVSQVGYMVLGIGTGNPIGIAGGLFHMFNNAIYKSCLFFAGGNVEKKAGSTDLANLGGLAKYMPVTFACFLVASLSISGVPPFNGFVSKWMIYQGIIESANSKNPLWMVWLTAAMFGSALTIASFMKLLHAIFLGRPSKNMCNVREASVPMLFPVTVLATLCFLFGVTAFVFPLPVLILPAAGLPVIYLGTWNPVIATILIAIGIIAGLLIYPLVRKGKFRVVPVFIGGEDVARLDRISGTEFYDTIKDLKGFSAIYRKEGDGVFDIYSLVRRVIYYFTGILERLHNGILPTYLVWCLIGMAVIFLALFLRLV